MTFRILTLLLLLALGGCAQPPTSVLLVSLDTLRADAVAGMPNLSRLAAEGVSFPRVYSGSNWTLPSHASLLLSQPPSEHRVVYSAKPPATHSVLPADAVVLSEAFRSQGFRTFSSTEGGYVSPVFGFTRGFDRVDQVHALSHDPGADIDLHVDALARFVRESDSTPIFAFVHTYRVHDYFLNEPRFQSELAPEDAPWTRRGTLLQLITQTDGTAPPGAMLHRLYRGAALDADRFVGRLLEGLRAADPKRRWIVSLTSDHGESFVDNPPLRGHGTALNEDQLRVPWIVTSTDPKIREELHLRRPAAIANGIDVGPSLLGYLELPIPPSFRGRADLLLPAAPAAELPLESSFVLTGDGDATPMPNLALLARERALRAIWQPHGVPNFECFRREGGTSGYEAWRLDPGTCRDFEIVARDRLRSWVAASFAAHPERGGPVVSDELRAELQSLGYL